MTVTRERSPIGDGIRAWLETAPVDPVPLIMWLQGKRMPPIDRAIEPHQYLQQWLSGGHRLNTERDRLAPLLTNTLDRIRADKLLEKISRPGEFIYNLGMFCAFVSRPAILAEPLQALIESLGEAKEWGDLQRRAFRIAVQHNDDGRFKAMWKKMAEDGYHPFFGTDMRDAVRGLLWSSSGADEGCRAGMPDWTGLGPAFCRYARQLESGEYDRRLEFRHLVQEAEQVFQAIPRDQWNGALLDAAEQYQWPRWAIETLPTLRVKIDTNTYRVWQPCVSLYESILELDAEHCRSMGRDDTALHEAMKRVRDGERLVTVVVAEYATTKFLNISNFLEPRRLQMKVWRDPSVDAALEAIQRDFLEAHEAALKDSPTSNGPTRADVPDKLSETLARNQRSYPISLQKRQHAVPVGENTFEMAEI